MPSDKPAAPPSFWDLGAIDINQRSTVRGRPPAKEAAKATLGPRSLGRVLQILQTLGESHEGASLGELCARLQAPRSSTFALVQPLAGLGYLSRSQGRYRLGPRAFALATAILSTHDDAYLVEATMGHLSEQTAFTVMHTEFLREASAAVHRRVFQSQRSIRYMASIGVQRPLLSTACGRAMLAFAGEDWTARYLDAVAAKPSLKRGSPARRAFDRQLAQIRAEGVACSIGEFDAAIGAVAAPILGADGVAVGSIGVAGLSSEIRAEYASVAPLVREAGRALSEGHGRLRPPAPATP